MVVVGTEQAREELMEHLHGDFDLEHEHMVEKEGDQAKLLGRTLLKIGRGFAIINDGAYAKDLEKIFDLGSNSKAVTTPAAMEGGATDAPGDGLLDEGRQSKLRTAIGKLLWLAQDRAT